jgi:hypothetical protein
MTFALVVEDFMATVTLETMQQDNLVMSVARALTLANETAIAQGTEPADSLVTITEEGSSAGRSWRIHYGPRDYIGRRGGDLIVIVDERNASVQRIIRGQ